MDGVLSQEEINALLNNNDAADSSDEILTESEKDAIGEIANINLVKGTELVVEDLLGNIETENFDRVKRSKSVLDHAELEGAVDIFPGDVD